jgi:hypothetical protein
MRRRHTVVGLLALGLLAGACNHKPLPEAPNCSLFPPNNYWHANVSDLPVHDMSDEWVASIGADDGVHMDFGQGLWNGAPIGIPYTTVGAGQPLVPITFYYPDSDPGPYPIPPNAPVEGGGDRHVLVVDRDACVLYEVFDARKQTNGSWRAGSGAVWNLRSNAFRPDGWTSADAAGLPILPALVRPDEVASGTIGHALRFTAPVTQEDYIWPARHEAGDEDATESDPPMGAWFRLKDDIDPLDFPAGVRPIVVALQTHGMILADNGSPWYMQGVPSEAWDNDLLHELDTIEGSDFEAVDTSSLIVHPDSGEFAP